MTATVLPFTRPKPVRLLERGHQRMFRELHENLKFEVLTKKLVEALERELSEAFPAGDRHAL